MIYPDRKVDYTTSFMEWWDGYSDNGTRYPTGGEVWMASKAAWDYAIISSLSLVQKTMC